jgi:arylsulfatase A-like enzyme
LKTSPAPATAVAALAALLASGCGAHPEEDGGTTSRPSAHPNIVLVVVDTLRADHLPFYGYPRDTAPQIAARLAKLGVVVEHASATAPWTMPSVASLLTGLDPQRLAADDGSLNHVPPEATTLASRLAAAGYETAGFSANPLLADYNGYARGFATFWTAPGGQKALQGHAPSLQAQITSWLERRGASGKPLFLYAHYIDPHDPYDNPDMFRGRSPFAPLYRGEVRGVDVQGLYDGQKQVADVDAAARALTAFYDAELLYVDRFVAGVVQLAHEKLGPDTLFVFTADHGEELHDHGGWKHGQSLYEEQLRVPLVFRWDGRIAAGRRLSGGVSLLDLAPTLLAAAGVEAAGLDGRNLLPSLLDAATPLPRRALVTRHWNFGALRVAAQAGTTKVALYNRREPFTSAQSLQVHLEEIDHARLARVARFDLAADPGELHPRAGEWSALERALADSALAYVDASLAGLRVVARDLPPGATLEGTLRLAAQPSGAIAPWPLFLADADEAKAAGGEIRFRLGADEIAKGFVLRATGDLATLELRVADAPVGSTIAVRFGKGERWTGGAIRASALARDDWPRGDGQPELWLWTRTPLAGTQPSAIARSETEQELRALGYLD